MKLIKITILSVLLLNAGHSIYSVFLAHPKEVRNTYGTAYEDGYHAAVNDLEQIYNPHE